MDTVTQADYVRGPYDGEQITDPEVLALALRLRGIDASVATLAVFGRTTLALHGALELYAERCEATVRTAPNAVVAATVTQNVADARTLARAVWVALGPLAPHDI